MIDVAYYLFNAFGMSATPGRLMLPRWVNVSEERFNEILSTVTEAKNSGLRINANGREITLNNVESLPKGIGSGKIDKHEFKNKCKNIVDDVKKVLDKPLVTRSQENMIKILLLLKEILKPKDKRTDEQPDTADMPDLESEESAEQSTRIKNFNTKSNA